MFGTLILFRYYDPPEEVPEGDEIFLVVSAGKGDVSGNYRTEELHVYKTKAEFAVQLIKQERYFVFDPYIHNDESPMMDEVALLIAEDEERIPKEVLANVKIVKHY